MAIPEKTTRGPVIKFGTCSWTDKTLLACKRFYPTTAKSATDKLQYYSTKYPVIEVDSSHWAIPPKVRTEGWVKTTPANFKFIIKAFQLFTNRNVDNVAKLPFIFKDKLSPELKARVGTVDASEIPSELQSEIWRYFNIILGPILEADKLGSVLFQFQSNFDPSPANFDHILQCRKLLDKRAVMALEFRCDAWLNSIYVGRTCAFCQENGFVLVAKDERTRLSLLYKKQQERLQSRQARFPVNSSFKPASTLSSPIKSSPQFLASRSPSKTTSSPRSPMSPNTVVAKTVKYQHARTGKVTEEREYSLADGSKAPRLGPICLRRTHPKMLYIRIHRREGHDRILEKQEFDEWVKRIDNFVKQNKLDENYVIYWLVNTNWEDQSMKNIANFDRAMRTLDSVQVFDWQAILREENKQSGIAGLFAKMTPKKKQTISSPKSPSADKLPKRSPNADNTEEGARTLGSPVKKRLFSQACPKPKVQSPRKKQKTDNKQKSIATFFSPKK